MRCDVRVCRLSALTVWLCLISFPFVSMADEVKISRPSPNVLLIIADDLSAAALGCYGNKQCRTPNIDALANRGLRFENAYCQFPVCGPSRAALMSGMYCQSIGVMGNGGSGNFSKVLGKRPSLSQFFRNQGYHSARVSKIYHMRVPGDITAGVDGPDHAASWTEKHNCRGPEWMSDGQHEHLTNERLKRLPERHYNLGFGGAFYTVRTRDPVGKMQPDKLAADKAIEIMRQQQKNRFFLAVGFVRPHVPLVAPTSYFEKYPADQMDLPKTVKDDWDDIPQQGISKNSQRIGLKTSTQKAKVLQAYYASVSYMDTQVGRVLTELKRLGLRGNTIVIFKSDHGYHLGEHDFWQKMSLHEESARIPLIVSLPSDDQPAATSALTEAIDLYPTLAAACGLDAPAHCQGVNLLPLWTRNGPTTLRDAAYCTTGRGHLLRTDRYAYLRHRKGKEELYDMQEDPRQFTNLVKSQPNHLILDELRKKLDRKLKSIPAEGTSKR